MVSLPVGLIIFLLVIAHTASGVDLSHYLNEHSFIVVFGGTIAVFFIGAPFTVVRSVFRNVLALFRKRLRLEDSHSELMNLAKNRGSVTASTDPLINYAIGQWEKGIDASTFIALISQYRDKLETEDAESVAALNALAKYPPALGMMGTVIGMISLFATLGSSNKGGLGPALATAMTATFYGLVTANGLLSPLVDRITVETIHRKKYFGAVYEILILINRREPSGMIEEELTNREAA